MCAWKRLKDTVGIANAAAHRIKKHE